MSIIGSDDRTQVTNVNSGNYANVVAVDSQTDGFLISRGIGSGYLIGPQHVLTNDHVLQRNADANRVTTSDRVGSLPNRNEIDESDPSITNNVTNVDNYNRGENPADIALLTLNEDLTTPGSVLGIITFMDPGVVIGLPVETAGYPISVNTDETARTMYTASGTIEEILEEYTERLGITRTEDYTFGFTYSDTVDAEVGQSGSGVWLDEDNNPFISDLDTGDLILGLTAFGNGGALITKEIYDSITTQMEADAGGEAAESASELPENVIVGSDSNDTIVGSYRRELIFVESGQNTISGNGGDDRIVLSGGSNQVDGGEGLKLLPII